jgi:hypothetical protein
LGLNELVKIAHLEDNPNINTALAFSNIKTGLTECLGKIITS